jgi:small subunit ribosomal protein S6
MDKNVYESAVLINAALDDEQIENLIARIKENINNNGGEIIEVENWGRKRLAYMVKKSKIGYYIFFRFNAPSNMVSKLERFYSLEENILRYLTVFLDKDALEQLELNKKQSSVGVEENNPENKKDSNAEEETENESSVK